MKNDRKIITKEQFLKASMQCETCIPQDADTLECYTCKPDWDKLPSAEPIIEAAKERLASVESLQTNGVLLPDETYLWMAKLKSDLERVKG